MKIKTLLKKYTIKEKYENFNNLLENNNNINIQLLPFI